MEKGDVHSWAQAVTVCRKQGRRAVCQAVCPEVSALSHLIQSPRPRALRRPALKVQEVLKFFEQAARANGPLHVCRARCARARCAPGAEAGVAVRRRDWAPAARAERQTAVKGPWAPCHCGSLHWGGRLAQNSGRSRATRQRQGSCFLHRPKHATGQVASKSCPYNLRKQNATCRMQRACAKRTHNSTSGFCPVLALRRPHLGPSARRACGRASSPATTTSYGRANVWLTRRGGGAAFRRTRGLTIQASIAVPFAGQLGESVVHHTHLLISRSTALLFVSSPQA